MNILDENVPASQRALLLAWRIRIRQIGFEVASKGIKDEQIIPLLRSLGRATFFTLDRDFADPRLCHQAYCLVYLDVEDYDAAATVRRILKHPMLNTQAKRFGAVVRASHTGILIWRRNADEQTLSWPS
ncbi:MAG: hypothetical protein IT306_18410 [Chloroflexi bacterium]|nr:hypothetical protein [Chloroflexota bacterium]